MEKAFDNKTRDIHLIVLVRFLQRLLKNIILYDLKIQVSNPIPKRLVPTRNMMHFAVDNPF